MCAIHVETYGIHVETCDIHVGVQYIKYSATPRVNILIVVHYIIVRKKCKHYDMNHEIIHGRQVLLR